MASLCVNTDEAVCFQTVARFATDVETGDSENARHLALLCLGEIGKQKNLSAQANLQSVVLGAFESGSEETKSAAAYALGNTAVGNMATYLPVLLEALGSGRHQYLLLSALKEVNSCGCKF